MYGAGNCYSAGKFTQEKLDTTKLQEKQAKILNKNSDVQIFDDKTTIEDLNIFADHLGCEVNIVDVQHFFNITHT